MTKDVRFFDGLSSIQIQNGIVKLVFAGQDTAPEKGKTPVLTPKDTIAMPINAFIYALTVFIDDERNQEMIGKMKEAIQAAGKSS